MNTYLYRAYFERLDRCADGTVEANTADEAQSIVYGMSGEWLESDTDPRWSFEAGIPDYVKVEQLP